MVIDPVALIKEVAEIKSRGLLANDEYFISEQAHVVMPYHLFLDEQREKGSSKIGTTKRGIGPAYEYKAKRAGIRMHDLLDENSLANKLMAIKEDLGLSSINELLHVFLNIGEKLRPRIANTGKMVHDLMTKGDKKVLFEGAQGTLLDVDHGTYPFVTSSSAVSGGACTGVGIGPTMIGAVVGITKAYTTRVGDGPFPTEMAPEESAKWRAAGDEFGASTGRPRRCGWLDLPMLRLSARLSGVSSWAITKMDIMAGMGNVPVCTHYKNKKTGDLETEFPAARLAEFDPVYTIVEGWSKEISQAKSYKELSIEAKKYIELIETETDVKTSIISVGPGREETIVL
jgi:adenylosuccinate synthase